jgi:hypothetical protein
MKPNTNFTSKKFLVHQKLWGLALLLGWFSINILVLATTKAMELHSSGKVIPLWEPFCWEISSALLILCLIPLAIFIHDRWLDKLSLKHTLILHSLLSLPFSIAHVAGMVAIRKLCYYWADSQYIFGELPMEFFYEYRKYAQSYLSLALVIFGYRLIVRRLQGEASYLQEEDKKDDLCNKTPMTSPERLLIKKLGREFLIQTVAIEWVEAAGNYANLHLKNSVYPMRMTMDKLEKLLPPQFARIHRSTIINMEQMLEMQPMESGDYQLTLKNEKTLTLSRSYRDEFKARLSM